MKDVFGNGKRTEEWLVQVTYPRAMRPPTSDSFCAWWTKTGAQLEQSQGGIDGKDRDAEIFVELFKFQTFEAAREFCDYTHQQLEKWSGAGKERRYTIKLRGQVKFKDKTEGRIGANHPRLRDGG